jgi:hypothetical protein
MAALEVQTKTGDGWPHWHVMAWCPDGRSVEQLKAAAVKRWTTRTEEEIDIETGEVLRLSSVEPIGFVDVQIARDRVAAGTYIAKYLAKPWDAVPQWMGDSSKRFRKLRASGGFYDVMEKLHRHTRNRGGRKQRKGTGRHTRRLFERMAASGASSNIFRKERGGLVYVGTVPVPQGEWPRLAASMASFAQLGPLTRCRLAISSAQLRRIYAESGQWRERRAALVRLKVEYLRSQWAEVQARKGSDGVHGVERARRRLRRGGRPKSWMGRASGGEVQDDSFLVHRAPES